MFFPEIAEKGGEEPVNPDNWGKRGCNMDVQSVSQPKVLLDHRALEADVDVFNAADLNLRTAEGDMVQLSFSNEYSFSGSKSETVQEGAVTQEISTVAQAAAKYSLAVEGDLNEDELNAIQELAQRIEPIATNFFQNGEFNFEEAAGSLTASLGVLTEIELSLERAISATFGFEQTQITENPGGSEVSPEQTVANPDPSQLLSGAQDTGSFNFPKVRDITELVLSVVESEFPARGVEILGDQSIVRSLRDLMAFLRDRITGALGENQTPQAETAPAESTPTADVADFVEV